jgi:hypothetical protein
MAQTLHRRIVHLRLRRFRRISSNAARLCPPNDSKRNRIFTKLVAAASVNHDTALLTVVALIAISGAVFAEPPVPSNTESSSTTDDLPSVEAPARSAWSAPEPWRTDRFYLGTSIYTRHFNYDAAHDNHQELIQGEWNITERWLVGASLFDNSFGQPTQYVYGGYRWRPFDKLQPLYLKFTAGLVHGYTGQYQNKIPNNSSGIAPVIIPSVGYCLSRFCSEIVIFGAAGAMVTIGVTIP